MSSIHLSVGIVIVGVGLLFLLLSLIAAYRDVFPPADHMEQLRRTHDSRSYAELLATLSTVKSWLALAVVGSVLVFGGSFVVSGGSGVIGAIGGISAVAPVK